MVSSLEMNWAGGPGHSPLAGARLRPGIPARRLRSDETIGPAIRWGQLLPIECEADHTRLDQVIQYKLVHGQPGDIIDHLLLGRIVGLQAGSLIKHEIVLFQLLLYRLLLRCISLIVLTIIHS